MENFFPHLVMPASNSQIAGSLPGGVLNEQVGAVTDKKLDTPGGDLLISPQKNIERRSKTAEFGSRDFA